MPSYRCAGLKIACDFELPAISVGFEEDSVRVRWGGYREVPAIRPSPIVIAERVVGGVAWYTFCKVGNAVVGRFPGLADFEIAADGSSVTCWAAPEVDQGLIGVVVAGTVTAYLLCQRGLLVLHASAVEVDGQALAFVGQSGRGKTTTAAIMCADGAPLITDDVLPLQRRQGEEAFFCAPGALELRLREKAASLAEQFPTSASKLTADGRIGVRPERCETEVRLGSVLIVEPTKHRPMVTVEEIDGGLATLLLAQSQRIEGWRDPIALASHFDTLAALVDRVRVLRLFVPWGPPWASDLAQQIAKSALAS